MSACLSLVHNSEADTADTFLQQTPGLRCDARTLNPGILVTRLSIMSDNKKHAANCIDPAAAKSLLTIASYTSCT